MTSDANGVVALGEAMGLLRGEPSKPLSHADRFQAEIAGAEANVVTGLARLGHNTRFVSNVGDDAFGRRIIRTLRGEGVDVTTVGVDHGRPTGMLVRDTLADRPIEVQYYRAGSAASAMEPGQIGRHIYEGMSLAHTTGITAMLSESAGDAVEVFLHQASEAGLRTSFDVNMRRKLGSDHDWRERLGPVLPLVDVLFVALDELSALTDLDLTPAEAYRFLHDRGPDVVVLKCGAQGAEVSVADRPVVSVPAIPVTIVDPVGAGDALVSGFLGTVLDAGSTNAVDHTTALRMGVGAAAAVLGSVGDQTGLPSREALAAICNRTTETKR